MTVLVTGLRLISPDRVPEIHEDIIYLIHITIVEDPIKLITSRLRLGELTVFFRINLQDQYLSKMTKGLISTPRLGAQTSRKLACFKI